MNKFSIGIDLGTTNSLISYFDGEQPILIPNALGEFLTPSVVSFEENQFYCGQIAKNRLLTHPQNTVALFKRTMGTPKEYNLAGKTYRSEELSAIVLKQLADDAKVYLNNKYANVEILDVVISVPAYFNSKQRLATCQAGKLAGLNVIRTISEPSAAACYYGLKESLIDSTCVILDLGGGTFDISVVSVFEGLYEIVSSGGDNYLGGNDFTQVIFKHFENLVNKENIKITLKEVAKLNNLAEKAKISLNYHDSFKESIELSEKRIELTINKSTFESLCSNLIERLKIPIERVIRSIKKEELEIDSVILVGGSSRMSIFKSTVATLFKKLPRSSFQPDHAIAAGAAIVSNMIQDKNEIKETVLTDVSAYSLGISAYDNGNLRFFPIIEKNSTIPVSQTKDFITHGGQEEVKIKVYQGESFNHEDNFYLGELKFKSYSKLASELLVTFTYDLNCVLQVEIRENGEIIESGYFSSSQENLNEEELNELFKKLDSLKCIPQEDQKVQHLKSKLMLLFEEFSGEERDQIANLIIRLESVSKTFDQNQIDNEISIIKKLLNENLKIILED